MSAIAVAGCQPIVGDRVSVGEIEALMHATWDRPDSELAVGPVAVANDFAVADWTQGAMGGRALLDRSQSRWRVVLCAGDQIRTLEGLVAAGVPRNVATRLSQGLARLERDTDSARLEAMSRFEGVVRMR